MRRWIAAAAIAAAMAAAPGIALAGAPAAVAKKKCAAGYVRAVIGGEVKCLHAGQYCDRAHEAKYREKGFTCTKGRLRRR